MISDAPTEARRMLHEKVCVRESRKFFYGGGVRCSCHQRVSIWENYLVTIPRHTNQSYSAVGVGRGRRVMARICEHLCARGVRDGS